MNRITFAKKYLSSQPSNLYFFAYVFIALIFSFSVFWIFQQKQISFQNSYAHYQQKMLYNHVANTERVNDIFFGIYKSLRIISMLPSLKIIDRHGKNIDDDDLEVIQQIYNNLSYDTDVSEIYIIPANFDHEMIDSVTLKKQEPILMFDRHIKSPNIEMQHGDESYEYAYFTDLVKRLRNVKFDMGAVKSGKVPMYTSPEIITCDNTKYNLTLNDNDRKGIILSTPYFDRQGNFLGVISAIIRSNVIRSMVNDRYSAIVHDALKISISSNEIDMDKSGIKSSVSESTINRSYIKNLPLDFVDNSGWSLLVSRPKNEFLQSEEVKLIRRNEHLSYLFCILIAGFSVWLIHIFKNRLLLEKYNTDIAARLHEKEKMQQLMQQHITSVQEAHQRALRAVEAAEKADNSKSEFLANMSHELRTPMNSIIGMTRLLLEEESVKGEVWEMVNIVRKSSQSLLELLNDILDLSKIEAKSLHLEIISFNVNEEAQNVIETLSPLASEKGLSLSAELPEYMPPIMGDPLRFGRILTNLIGNAIKYTRSGKVVLSINYNEISAEKILVSASITDTGIGIAQDKLPLIFEKFTQADTSNTRQFGGTGLGLAITRHLVDLMGGSIHVVSEEHKGSVFSFSIPFQRADHHSCVSQSFVATGENLEYRGDRIAAEKARILIAEDHPLNQILIKKLLKKLGVEQIVLVENGAMALERIIAEKI